MRILPLGACNLSGPISAALRLSMGVSVAPVATGGSTPSVYSFGEMQQLVSFLRGDLHITPEMRPLCDYSVNYRPRKNRLDNGDIDVVLVEPNATVDVEFDGYKINRAGIFATLTDEFKLRVPEAQNPISRWYNKGLLTQNEDIRAEASETMVSLLPTDFPSYQLMIDFIRGARGVTSSIDGGMEMLLEVFGRKIGVLVYSYQYLPDGRAISWPPELLELTERACERYNLPLFRPYEHVAEYGATRAIREDTRHYSDEFRPVIAQKLIEFASDISAS